jgi:hypothetical protein
LVGKKMKQISQAYFSSQLNGLCCSRRSVGPAVGSVEHAGKLPTCLFAEAVHGAGQKKAKVRKEDADGPITAAHRGIAAKHVLPPLFIQLLLPAGRLTSRPAPFFAGDIHGEAVRGYPTPV